jgi:protein SCO1
MGRGLKAAFFTLPIALAALLVALMIEGKIEETTSERQISKLTGFSLIDQNGKPFTDADLKGKVNVVNFMFTTCRGICPILSKEMKALSSSFSRYGTFSLLSISVDPENDTPEQIRAWRKKQGVNNERWSFITGQRKDIRQLLEEQFLVGLPDDPNIHSDRFMLLDRENVIQGSYQLSRPETLESLKRDIMELLKN